MKGIKVFEAFSGIGTQRMALRNLGIEHEVETEKLYTVEIPDPNSNWKYTFLTKRGYRGVIINKTDDDCWEKDKNSQLTEAEIRKDFEWAWQWAKEV